LNIGSKIGRIGCTIFSSFPSRERKSGRTLVKFQLVILETVMKFHGFLFAAFVFALTLQPMTAQTQSSAKVTQFASGFNNPRGLKFGPDGYLYVAEGGTGGTQTTTTDDCPQVPEVGPYSGGFTASISRVDRHRKREVVIDGLPSSQTSAASGGFVSGVGDIAFIGNKLYAVLAGAGCSHGLKGTVNGVIQIEDGSSTLVADLSTFIQNHPVKNPNPGDFEPDGTWYSLVSVGNTLYTVEPNHGELDKVTQRGQISRVIDISASQGHIVPTALIELFDGVFLISNLDTFPVVPGSSSLFAATSHGAIAKLTSGFTTVLGLAARNGKLYVLEMSNVANGPAPATGEIVSIDLFGNRKTIVSGLDFPTAMTFGSDGSLYVSNKGFGFGPGDGEILRVQLH
jgi:hypothetical protein